MARLASDIFYSIFLLGWEIILGIVMVWKLRNDGVRYFHFYTNWNWTLQFVFFLLELIASTGVSKSLSMFNITIMFWWVMGTTTLVFFLVFVMFHDNADFLLKLMKENGGPYDSWVVLDANAVFHVLILVSMLIYILFRKKDIDDCIYPVLWRTPKQEKRLKKWQAELALEDEEDYFEDGCDWIECSPQFSWNYFIYVIMCPASFIGIYMLSFDVYTVYGLTTNVGVLCVFGLIVLIIFNGSYVIVLMLYFVKPRSRVYKGAERLTMFKLLHGFFNFSQWRLPGT